VTCSLAAVSPVMVSLSWTPTTFRVRYFSVAAAGAAKTGEVRSMRKTVMDFMKDARLAYPTHSTSLASSVVNMPSVIVSSRVILRA
jgi:hypothetical protein